jgi:hypothetical protein
MNNIKLTDKQLRLLHSVILEKIEQIDKKRNESIEYIETIQNIELILGDKIK